MTDCVQIAIPSTVYAMDLERHQVVEASAGTGKTFLLEHRVVDLIVRQGIEIDKILVVTFTEKATAELRQRIREKLQSLLVARDSTAGPQDPSWDIDKSARERIRAALEAFDRAPISTIHAFCHRILSESAFAAGHLLEQEQVSTEAAFDQAFTACLRREFAVSEAMIPYLETWLEGGSRRVEALRGLLLEVHRRGGDIAPQFDEGAFHQAMERAAAALPATDLQDVFAEISHAGRRGAVIKRIRSLEAAASIWRDRGVAAALAPLGSADLRYLERIDPLPTAGGTLVTAALAVEAARVSLEAAIAALFYPPLAARAEIEKQRRGHFDFDDMLNLVWKALDGHRGNHLAAELRRRFPCALIDEFQDTDPVQWNIFRRIYLDQGTSGQLTLVGDPKQAIYSFRGADLHTYMQAREEVLSTGGQLTTLATNYRSTAAMVEACNHVFAGPTPFFTGGVTYDTPVSPGLDLSAVDCRGEPVSPVCVWDVGSDSEKLSMDERRRCLETGIVSEIVALLRDEERGLRIGPPGLERPIDAGDVFVLTRSTAESYSIAEALRRAGISCSLFKQEGLLQTREAQEVRDLLVAIARPHSGAARLRAWQTRFFSVPLVELDRVHDLEDTHPLIARLHDWHTLGQRREFHRLFSEIMSVSRIVERELLLACDRRAISNFQHIFELLAAEAASTRCDMYQLAEKLQHWMDTVVGIDSEGINLQRPESDEPAVQVMTIHKSKGLENKVVFVAGGWGSGGGDRVRTLHRDGRRLTWVGGMTPEVADVARREVRAEDERLFYVALTRAVARMYLPHVSDTKITGPYAAVNERLSPALVQSATFDYQPVPRAAAATRAAEATNLQKRPANTGLDLEALYLAQRGRPITSYSQLQGGVAELGEKSSDALELASRGAGGDGLPGGRLLGIALHEILERLPFAPASSCDFEAWRQSPTIRIEFDRGLQGLGLSSQQRLQAERTIYESLRAPLQLGGTTIASLAQVTSEVRELEFMFSSAAEAPLVKGFIDLVFEHEGKIYVLDWKSDLLDNYLDDTMRQHVEAHYAVQASIYAYAIKLHLRGHDSVGFAGVVYFFLRGGCAYHIPPSHPLLDFERQVVLERAS